MKSNRKLTFGNISERIVQSEIRNMSLECDKINGINLSQGICDLELPVSVKNGAREAIDKGVNHYTRYDGLFELRSAIAKKAFSYNKINANPEKNVVVSCGATGAFYCACLALLSPGDEVIIFEPYYSYHVNTLLSVRADPVFVKMQPPNWHIDFDELDKVVGDKTRAIMINTPGNPSGKVFGVEELENLAEFCIKNNIFIFTDEIYEYFVYGNMKHISPACLSEIEDRTITISGHSKTFSITGWRIGYCICHERWAKMIGYINDLIYVCGPAPLQLGVARGIAELSEDFYNDLRSKYLSKRDTLCTTLNKVGLRPFIPDGAYYVLADISPLPGKTSKEKAMYLLNRTKVACVPGSAFYHDKSGDNLGRFCFAKSDEEIDLACKQLETLL